MSELGGGKAFLIIILKEIMKGEGVMCWQYKNENFHCQEKKKKTKQNEKAGDNMRNTETYYL